ncbi:hypothetical protein PX699_12705 [Sphingobium sp. H39-3-25]|uniref:hypothetical protein n=1 Tax=Sphingobium arseniciresistens TaxID=3030834 RepID=UPI0023B94943|nr:hypothetical protein [Sphingobium arseniciresistens]
MMRRYLLIAAMLPLAVGGCGLATLPVKTVGKAVDLTTTSQDEADRNAGRAQRKADEAERNAERAERRRERACARSRECSAAADRPIYFSPDRPRAWEPEDDG